MKPIVYNLSSIRPPITGIGRYAIELIRTAKHFDHDVRAYVAGEIRSGQDLVDILEQMDAAQPHSNYRLKELVGKLPYAREIYRKLQSIKYSKMLAQADLEDFITHDLNYSAPTSDVVTAYDVSHIICPQTHPRYRVDFLHDYFNKIKYNQSHILTISQHVKDELVSYYDISPQRISVTHLAADSAFKPRRENACQQFLSDNGLEYKKFVLCLATREPRKNLGACIESYSKLPTQLRMKFPLVIAGATGWKADDLENQISQLESRGEIIDLGYVEQTKLPLLYSSATAFIFPSFYEGFGLPLLEAMQSGCASITSSNGALAEVSNNAAIQIDPSDTQSLTSALEGLLNNIEHRKLLENQCIERASDFSWQSTVERTFRIYESL